LTFDHEYQEWQRIHHPRRANLESMTSTMSGWSTHPVISVIVPVFNPPLEFLTAAIASVRRQIYPYWELCIADDCSTDPKITSYLVSLSSQDLRIKVVFRKETGNISKATNSALDLATGEYAAFLDHDDELAPHALYHVAKSIVDDPAIDMIYTDEDKINEAGEYSEPFFKPDWSPEYMLACMYTCHLSVYRTFLVRQVGGLDSEFDTAQDYHLALRIIARQPRIHHIAHVLYHWRIHPRSAASGPDAKPGAHIVNRKALESFLVHSSPAGRVEAGPTLFFHRARYDIIGHPKISIVIPTASKFIPNKRRQVTHVQECVESIVRLSTYSQFEILVIHECDMPVELQRCLENLGAQLVPYDSRRSFNFSRTINHGVCHATGEYVTLMNDDIEVKSPDWMESMLEFGQLAEVGAVGCKLLFPTGTIQHAGVVILEAPRRPYYQSPEEERGYCHTNSVHRNVSAVTGACMMTKTDLFRSVGGFAEEFPLNYSDVDYCLKIRKRGKRIVYTPYPALYHHESATRMDGSVRPWELELFKRRWPEYIFHDPYYSPNLSRTECYTRLNLNEPCEVDATAKGTKAA